MKEIYAMFMGAGMFVFCFAGHELTRVCNQRKGDRAKAWIAAYLGAATIVLAALQAGLV